MPSPLRAVDSARSANSADDATVRAAPAQPSSKQILETALSELLRTAQRSDPLGEASIAAVECALRLVTVAEEAGRAPEADLADAAREALASIRAAVVATTYAIRSIDNRPAGTHVPPRLAESG